MNHFRPWEIQPLLLLDYGQFLGNRTAECFASEFISMGVCSEFHFTVVICEILFCSFFGVSSQNVVRIGWINCLCTWIMIIISKSWWQVVNFNGYLFTSALTYLYLVRIHFLAAKYQATVFLLGISHHWRVITACCLCYTYNPKQWNPFLETAD